MASIELDVDSISRVLDQRWEELSNMAINPPGKTANEKADQRRRINFWKTDILYRQTLLDHIKAENGASLVKVDRLSASDLDKVNEALDRLNEVIQRDQVFTNVITSVTELLSAADKLLLTAAKGT